MKTHDRAHLGSKLAFRIAIAAVFILLLAAAQGLPGRATATSRTPATPDVRFEGFLKAQGAGKWSIGDYHVIVDRQTTVIEKVGRAEVGAWLAVLADNDSNGSLHAELIYVVRPAGQNGPISQISGVLTKKLDPWWVVNGVPIQITTTTRIPEDPQVGWIVWAMAEQHGLEQWALVVEVIARSPAAVPVGFEGVIEEIGPDFWVVSRRRVELAPAMVISVGPPAVGHSVEIVATLAPDRTPVAHLARIVPPDEAVRLEAYVAGITDQGNSHQVWDMVIFPPGQWANPVVTVVHVNGNTFVDESRAVARREQWAEVTAAPLGAGEFQADQIRLEHPIPVTLSGALVRMTADEREPTDVDVGAAGRELPMRKMAGSWSRLQGRSVWVPQTSLDAMMLGQCQGDVVVDGLLLGNGVIWARQVRMLTPGDG